VQHDQPGITIGCDNVEGGREAARHLIGQGRRRIAFLGEASGRYPEFLDRYRGFCLAHEEAGLVPDPALQADAITTEQAGHDAMAALIAQGHRFDAVFAASDLIAIGAMHALAERGLSVPGDVAVVGFDDITAAGLASPPLTTVVQDARLAGATLVDTLLAQLRGEAPPCTTLPARLVVRKSSVSDAAPR